MPLSFHSLSHGSVPFGFYNIDTDGLLLDRVFFFCAEFCGAVQTLAAQPDETAAAATLAGHEFPDPGQIGDLMGAIHGVRHTGYLGAVYRRWPFPRDPRAFRQKLDGAANRPEVQGLLDRWAAPVALPVRREPHWAEVAVGAYRFSRAGFAELLGYVIRGGYPTWEGYEQGRMPAAVGDLVPVLERVENSGAGV